jgi:serine/threonine protein kinase
LSALRNVMKALGKFEIIEKIGNGAMGVVYKARDPYIGRLVALKTITTGLAEDPALLERFYQEARSAGALQHPNIVTIFELGKEGDTPFIAMEFLDGGSLDKLIDSHAPLSMAQKIGYIVYVCRALEYAHARNVIHRDIKPGNVMVSNDGTVKVVDFGIARLGDSGRTQTGLLIGTLGYMSPQQIRGKTADARSDIWAAGIMFYELLASQRPFTGDNQAALMMNILTQPTPSVLEAAPGTPPEVAAILEKMLQKELDARFQSMQEVLIELDPIWKRLQQGEVSRLVASGQELYDAHDLDRAEDLLRRALQYDAANTQAKSLLEKIHAQVRRQQIVPQMKARVEKGHNLLSSKQFDEAKAEAEAALHMDSSFQPARELLAQVQVAVERERALAQALRTSRQRLVEDDLPEAEAHLAKALEIDPASAAACDLQKQIREEKARRERQKKLAEIKHRARTLWSDLRYQECIDLLLPARRDFPGDAELAKLWETAQQDKAEHEKQALLTRARSLLGAQRFDEVLATLDQVFEQSPSDATALNLRALAEQGREEQSRAQHLREDLASLRTLVKDGEFPEALARGEKLLREFPEETEVAELVSYARSEQGQFERNARRDEWLQKINQAVKAERFAEAIQAAEQALGEFPRDAELKKALEQANQKQGRRERNDLLERRIREVRTKINREELTDAIQLARETLMAVGPDTDIRQLLTQAEVEYEEREKKKQEQQETMLAARTLADQGQFDQATVVVQDAIATRLFTSSDPQVTALLRDIDARKTPPSSPGAPVQAAKAASAAPASGSPSWTAGTGDPARDYVYQSATSLTPAAPLAAPPAASVQDASTSMFSATSVTGPAVQPVPPPRFPEAQPAVKSKRKKASQPQKVTADSNDFGATRIAEPQSQASPEQAFGTTLYERPPLPTRQPAEALPQPTARPFWKQPLVMALLVVVIVAGAGAAYYMTSGRKITEVGFNPPFNPAPDSVSNAAPNTAPPAEVPNEPTTVTPPAQLPVAQPIDPMAELAKKQDDLISQATKIAGRGDYDGAISKLSEADNLHGPRSAAIARLHTAYTEDKANRGLADLRQKEQGLWDSANGELAKGELDRAQSLFQQVISLPEGGVYKKDAQEFVATRIPNRREAERLFDSANQQSRQAKDENGWQQVVGNLQQALAKGLSDQHTVEAQALLKTATGSLSQLQAERESFSRLQTQWNDPATQKNKTALTALLDSFRKIAAANGPYKQQAADYATRAEALLAAIEHPANPTPTPSAPAPSASPQPPIDDSQIAVKKIIDDLSGAFARKDIASLKQLWPSMPSGQASTLEKSFGATKSFSRNFVPASVSVSGDTATVAGNYSGSFVIGSANTPSNGSFQATLKRQNGRWVIANLTM